MSFSHVTLGISDIDRAVAFYRPLMEALGWEERFATRNPPGPWAGWSPPGKDHPLFIVALPVDGAAPSPGNGSMLAFSVDTPAAVDTVHALALALGATDARAPGLRPQGHADYYGAELRDPDGNRLGVVCHAGSDPAATI